MNISCIPVTYVTEDIQNAASQDNVAGLGLIGRNFMGLAAAHGHASRNCRCKFGYYEVPILETAGYKQSM